MAIKFHFPKRALRETCLSPASGEERGLRKEMGEAEEPSYGTLGQSAVPTNTFFISQSAETQPLLSLLYPL